ncbi:MAG: hypothetical protein EOQ57_34540 [Mesorhizobium sp.]|nr:MAG: hypothetical protein EOQ57_34540 [Mesorhizobium sp.]TGV18023.1 hypothetical protein EN786_35540 [Mesorhizobium sp. M4B.F.Ca.ET.143.01.1.1]
MPMSPEIIRDYRRRIDESQKAAAMPPSGMRARPISDSVRMSLKSNQALQTLLTTPNTVSVMAFYDRTGKAWPIASYVVGRSDSFQVYALQEGSNQLAVTPLVTHGYEGRRKRRICLARKRQRRGRNSSVQSLAHGPFDPRFRSSGNQKSGVFPVAWQADEQQGIVRCNGIIYRRHHCRLCQYKAS